MKCALELLAISAEKRKENEALEAAKKAFELARRKKASEASTLKYCQTLADIIEENASNGLNPVSISHIDCDYKNPNFAKILIEQKGAYTDGRESFEPNDNEIDLDYLKQWFKNYCFKVETKSFEYWQYGLGKRIGEILVIEPDPDCL